jgi:hypothetical protein
VLTVADPSQVRVDYENFSVSFDLSQTMRYEPGASINEAGDPLTFQTEFIG